MDSAADGLQLSDPVVVAQPLSGLRHVGWDGLTKGLDINANRHAGTLPAGAPVRTDLTAAGGYSLALAATFGSVRSLVSVDRPSHTTGAGSGTSMGLKPMLS